MSISSNPIVAKDGIWNFWLVIRQNVHMLSMPVHMAFSTFASHKFQNSSFTTLCTLVDRYCEQVRHMGNCETVLDKAPGHVPQIHF